MCIRDRSCSASTARTSPAGADGSSTRSTDDARATSCWCSAPPRPDERRVASPPAAACSVEAIIRSYPSQSPRISHSPVPGIESEETLQRRGAWLNRWLQSRGADCFWTVDLGAALKEQAIGNLSAVGVVMSEDDQATLNGHAVRQR